MSDQAVVEPPAATVRKTADDVARRLVFTPQPGAHWFVDCLAVRLPQVWVNRLREEWARRQVSRDGSWLPTRSLTELLCGVDPAVIYAGSDATSGLLLYSFAGIDTDVLTEAIASWATTAITNQVDWYTVLCPEDLTFEPQRLDLLQCGTRPNGTAEPAAHVYRLLPTFLAKQVTDHGLELLGKQRRSFILGPPRTDGRRTAVLWPPETIDDEDGPGLVTLKINFHVETIHGVPAMQIHADASISRFPLLPIAYVPRRGNGPATMSVWLDAPEGFLGRDDEPHTLLAATARCEATRESGYRWQWSPGLSTALARLTQLRFPNPEALVADPPAAATPEDPRAIRAFLLYSEGVRSHAPDDDGTTAIEEDSADTYRAKTLRHAAETGLVPGDHLEIYTRIRDVLEPVGIEPVEDLPRIGSRTARLIKGTFAADTTNIIEVRTQSDVTLEAILATLQHYEHFRLTPSPDTADDNVIHFTGKYRITVRLHRDATIAAGIPRDPLKKKNTSVLLNQHANRIRDHLGESPERVAAIVELEGAAHFSRAGLVDPKKALKLAFGRTNRRLQCLRPVPLFKPPTTWPENAKRAKPTPYPGTRFKRGSIERTAAAISDCLRQLGQFGPYQLPAGVPPFEQIGIWLHHDGPVCVPIVVRQAADGAATAHLAGREGDEPLIMPYADLPVALARGSGRLGSSDRQKVEVASFLRNALGVGEHQTDNHDRVVFVRAAGFRNWGWDWLQDQHLRFDELIEPGQKIDDDQPLAPVRPPALAPGLRIVRIRDRGTSMEVGRTFAHDFEKHHPRVSGLFGISDRNFYSINPKPDQNQTPHGRTKIDPDILDNFTVRAANPVPIEICVAYKQPNDNPEVLAVMTSLLRRAHIHTRQATIYPSVLHLCYLAAEYL